MTDDRKIPLDAAGLAKKLRYAGASSIHMRRARGLPLPPAIKLPGRRQLFWDPSTVDDWLKSIEEPAEGGMQETTRPAKANGSVDNIRYSTPGREHPARRRNRRYIR
nr:hypothetical protein [Abyssibacter sp.]